MERGAIHGRDGGAERIAWETLIVMKSCFLQGARNESGAITQVLDLVKTFEQVSLPVAHYNFPRLILRMLCAYLAHQ